MVHMNHNNKDMSLRDYLAFDRTKLANERTYLGYIRTFISLLAAGVGFIRFVDIDAAKYMGIALCIISPAFIILGTYKFLAMRKEIAAQSQLTQHN